MQSMFAALLERIKEPLHPDRGVKTDSSILLNLSTPSFRIFRPGGSRSRTWI